MWKMPTLWWSYTDNKPERTLEGPVRPGRCQKALTSVPFNRKVDGAENWSPLCTLEAIIDRTLPTAPFQGPLAAKHHAIQIAKNYQMLSSDSQPIFTQQFVSAFFHPRSDPNNPNVRIYELPSFMTDSASSALTCAIRAATLAHYGKQSGDQSMQLEACRWYGKGLQSQLLENERTQNILATGGNVKKKINEMTICSPIMFSIFESLMTTSGPAGGQHMQAAARMLEMMGPENCRHGNIHQLFRTVRLTTVS